MLGKSRDCGDRRESWHVDRPGLDIMPKSLTCLWTGGRENGHTGNSQVGDGLQDLGTKQKKAWSLDQHHRWQSKWAIGERPRGMAQLSRGSRAVCQGSCQKGRQWSAWVLLGAALQLFDKAPSPFLLSVFVLFVCFTSCPSPSCKRHRS